MSAATARAQRPAAKPRPKTRAKSAVPRKAAPQKSTAKRATGPKTGSKKSVAKKSTAQKKISTNNSSSKKSVAAGRAPLFLIDVGALRSRTRRRRAVLLSLLLLVAAFFGVALVQAQLVQTQAEVDRVETEINRLENDLALLEREVVEASSPEVIVERARRLGMVRAVRPVYLVATRPIGP